MKTPNIPDNEAERLLALNSYHILDTLSEEEYDSITRVASEICQTPIAVISLIDHDRQWFKSRIGIGPAETSREVSFCAHAINHPDDVFIVSDARLDERFHDNPLVTGDPHIVFYAGVPLIDEKGFALGTICTIDNKPRKLTENQLSALRVLSKKVIAMLTLRMRNMQLEQEKNFLYDAINFTAPYFLILNRDKKIIAHGDSYKKSLPELIPGCSFDDFFVWDTQFDLDQVFVHRQSLNKLIFYSSKKGALRFKCSFKPYDGHTLIIFANAVINSQLPISNYKLSLNDFPKHDYITEFLFLQQAAVKGLEDSKKLNENLLQKNKELEVARKDLININIVLEKKIEERTQKVRSLALFPAQNPNPVFEIDAIHKKILFINSSAISFFGEPDKIIFEDLINILQFTQSQLENKELSKVTFVFKDKVFERNTFFSETTQTFRVYLHDLTEITQVQLQLAEKNESLKKAYEQLVELQSDIIKQEKLATLGMLIAGIAHEINTPLGAIKASNENINDTFNTVLVRQTANMDTTTLKNAVNLFLLYRKPEAVLSTREERNLLKQIDTDFRNKLSGVQEQSGFFTRKIYELGFQWVETSLIPYIEDVNSKVIFSFATNMVKVMKSVDTIGLAVEKASGVVKALNQFSHGNINKELSEFNLRESIESIITILWNRIKQGAQVTLDIDKEVLLYGNQEELSQVWTNIINNALQASENKCLIHIRYKKTADFHEIEISNNGPQIPQEVLPKIFDPFFSTKKRGEGTGLGLNIVKKIIDKHEGNITCVSTEKSTSFIIHLPFSLKP